MAISVRLESDFVQEMKVRASAERRSTPKQIEYTAKIGQMAIDNPDLSYAFIKETLLAKAEVETGLATKYVRRTKRS